MERKLRVQNILHAAYSCMLEVHIRPERSGGYRVEYIRVTQWFATQAQAIAWAQRSARIASSFATAPTA